MRYAILGDVHGNWEALSTVLEHAAAQGVTRYACIGDVVGYNAEPVRCLERLRELDCVTVLGNHDQYCSRDGQLSGLSPVAAEAVVWTRRQIDDGHREYLSGLPVKLSVDGFTLVHNTLRPRDEWDYTFNVGDAERSFSRQTDQLCLHGHTHVPVAFRKRDRVTLGMYRRLRIAPDTQYFVNVGSVGQPRDRDPRAAYVLYDTDRQEIELRRLQYDLRATQQKIARAGLPDWLATRLAFGI